ncbi:MAG: UDP-N-acetylglucosamine--LPS N-acetylglucosamine transferase [Clostridium sp.]|nr:UDP-N-acetylglucosamine--LPS N-acetylglucosamine transferase [Clostridium sp.]
MESAKRIHGIPESVSPRICLLSSSGGHLLHLLLLKGYWEKRDRFWVTFDKEDARGLLEGEKMFPCRFPTNRNIRNLFRNFAVAARILYKEKPDILISTGAAVAVPFFVLGKLMGKKLVFVEVFDRVDGLTLTGKLVYRLADLFIVQWEEAARKYKRAVCLGSIF